VRGGQTNGTRPRINFDARVSVIGLVEKNPERPQTGGTNYSRNQLLIRFYCLIYCKNNYSRLEWLSEVDEPSAAIKSVYFSTV
jgi:hypothetical protein